MIVYWGMLIWVFLIGWFQPIENNPLKSNTAEAYRPTWVMTLALMAPVTFFSAVRGYIMDTGGYIKSFILMPSDMTYFQEWIDSRGGSVCFYGLQMLFKCFVSTDWQGWLATISVIQGLLIAYTLRKYSPNIAMSVYVFMASTTFTWMMNGMRQFLAITILFGLSECIVKNRWYIYVPAVLLLGGVGPIAELFGWTDVPWYLQGIHQSCLIMIPVFFLLQGKSWNWKMWLFTGVFLFLIMTGSLESLIMDTAEETEYAGDIHYFQQTEGDDGVHPLRVLVAAFPAIMAFMKRKEIDEMENVPPIIPIAINASLLTTLMYVAAMMTSGILIGRLPMYTELYNLILIPWLILNPYKKSSRIITIGLYGAYAFWFIYQMYIAWGGCMYHSLFLGWHIY